MSEETITRIYCMGKEVYFFNKRKSMSAVVVFLLSQHLGGVDSCIFGFLRQASLNLK